MSNPRVYLDISINGSPPERIVIELFADVVPKTAKNFRSLCVGFKSATGKHLHYKGCVFYKIFKGFYTQTGDFEKQNGTGGESIYGRTFPDENFKLRHSGPGILSMANSGPNKNGSRFLLSFSRQPFLDGGHVVFGKVIKGIETVQNIELMGTSVGKPLGLVQITDCGEVSEDKKTNVLESDKPQSSLVTKEESEAKLQKDKDSKKYELPDEKLEAALKNNKLVTNDNDRGLSSEKPSSNPNQHSDDPRKSRGDQSPVRKRSKKSESPISEDKKNNVTESDKGIKKKTRKRAKSFDERVKKQSGSTVSDKRKKRRKYSSSSSDLKSYSSECDSFPEADSDSSSSSDGRRGKKKSKKRNGKQNKKKRKALTAGSSKRKSKCSSSSGDEKPNRRNVVKDKHNHPSSSEGNDREVTSEKPSTNPNQHSDDPRRPRSDQSSVRNQSKKSASSISNRDTRRLSFSEDNKSSPKETDQVETRSLSRSRSSYGTKTQLEKGLVSLRKIPLHKNTVHLALSCPHAGLISLVMFGEGIIIEDIPIAPHHHETEARQEQELFQV